MYLIHVMNICWTGFKCAHTQIEEIIFFLFEYFKNLWNSRFITLKSYLDKFNLQIVVGTNACTFLAKKSNSLNSLDLIYNNMT